MIGGVRPKTIGASSYKNDPLYAFGKAFTEACESCLNLEQFDIFQEPKRAIHNSAIRESLKEFFVNDFVDEANKTPEEIEEARRDAAELFENDITAMLENSYQSEYSPMVGMALPIHKLILMNNVFSQGGGIQKGVAVQPSFSISLERRMLVKPNGEEIDMFLEQNKIADAIDATAPTQIFELSLPQKEGDTDILGELGGSALDELSTTTKVVGVYVEDVYFAEGDVLPDADGWFNPKRGEVATAETAGTRNVWFHTDIEFKPFYGIPGKDDRTLSSPITITYKTSATAETTLMDKIFGSMTNSKITLVSANNKISKVRLAAKLNTSNAQLDMCSTKWRTTTELVEIPEATPVNTTISPEEVKDISASYDYNQVTKVMSMTKIALSEYKDMRIKRQLDESYDQMDERNSFAGTFDFAPPENYALDYVSHRMATFMDYFDDYVTEMLQVLNDQNMTVTIFGDPRVVRKVTPTEYTYTSPAQIGPVTLDYTQTVVDTKDHRVYNFVGSDKLRNTNEFMVILNPRNTDRICYRIYDYQMYMSNEVRNAANPALPAIHSFERWKMIQMLPVQGRIQILNPSGMR